MKIVRETLLEFHKGKDPLTSLGVGGYYDVWRDVFDGKPIIKVFARLIDRWKNESDYELDLIYIKSHPDWKKEGMYFTDSKFKMFFLGRVDESVLFDEKEYVNKNIIDPLVKEGAKGAEKVLDWYADEMYEGDQPDFLSYLNLWFIDFERYRVTKMWVENMVHQ